MKEEILIKIMSNHIRKGLNKYQLRDMPLFKKLPQEQFDKCFFYAKKPVVSEKAKERQKRVKKYGRFIGLKISEELYQKLWRVFTQQVSISARKKNQSHLLRNFIEEALKNKYKELGLDWEEQL